MFRTYDGVAIYVPAFVCAGWLITFGDGLLPISFFHTRFIDLIEVTHRQIAASACFSIYVKKLTSLKHCVRSQITRLKLQKSFCDLEHGASL